MVKIVDWGSKFRDWTHLETILSPSSHKTYECIYLPNKWKSVTEKQNSAPRRTIIQDSWWTECFPGLWKGGIIPGVLYIKHRKNVLAENHSITFLQNQLIWLLRNQACSFITCCIELFHRFKEIELLFKKAQMSFTRMKFIFIWTCTSFVCYTQTSANCMYKYLEFTKIGQGGRGDLKQRIYQNKLFTKII